MIIPSRCSLSARRRRVVVVCARVVVVCARVVVVIIQTDIRAEGLGAWSQAIKILAVLSPAGAHSALIRANCHKATEARTLTENQAIDILLA